MLEPWWSVLSTVMTVVADLLCAFYHEILGNGASHTLPWHPMHERLVYISEMVCKKATLDVECCRVLLQRNVEGRRIRCRLQKVYISLIRSCLDFAAVLDARASRTDKPVLGQISFRRACVNNIRARAANRRRQNDDNSVQYQLTHKLIYSLQPIRYKKTIRVLKMATSLSSILIATFYSAALR